MYFGNGSSNKIFSAKVLNGITSVFDPGKRDVMVVSLLSPIVSSSLSMVKQHHGAYSPKSPSIYTALPV